MKRERGGFSLPISWVRERGEWGGFERAWGRGRLGRALGAGLGHAQGRGAGSGRGCFSSNRPCYFLIKFIPRIEILN
jgi:hypothetical protein